MSAYGNVRDVFGARSGQPPTPEIAVVQRARRDATPRLTDVGSSRAPPARLGGGLSLYIFKVSLRNMLLPDSRARADSGVPSGRDRHAGCCPAAGAAAGPVGGRRSGPAAHTGDVRYIGTTEQCADARCVWSRAAGRDATAARRTGVRA